MLCMAYFTRKAIGPNHLGIAQDEIIEILIPLFSPLLNEFHLNQNGERTDKDGTLLYERHLVVAGDPDSDHLEWRDGPQLPGK